MAFVAATQAFVQHARTAVVSGQAAELALHAASTAARREVTSFVDDFYEKKIFDPYLQFASKEEEEAYRKREAERREAIEKALAKGTPEGDLLANRLAIDQLKDAGAHGADQSADYAPMLAGLRGTEAKLAAQAGKSPAAGTVAEAGPTAADPIDRIQAPVMIDPAVLAEIRATGVIVADQQGSGHGVSTRDSAAKSGGVVVT